MAMVSLDVPDDADANDMLRYDMVHGYSLTSVQLPLPVNVHETGEA